MNRVRPPIICERTFTGELACLIVFSYISPFTFFHFFFFKFNLCSTLNFQVLLSWIHRLIKQVANHANHGRVNDMCARAQDQSEQESRFGRDQRKICFLKLLQRKTHIRPK